MVSALGAPEGSKVSVKTTSKESPTFSTPVLFTRLVVVSPEFHPAVLAVGADPVPLKF